MIVDTLIDILTTEYKVPVFRQGSLSDDDAYPDEFFTYWNSYTEDHSHFDNEDYGYVWTFDVNFYSTDPDRTYSIIESVAALLKNNGFIVSGKGMDIMSDEPSHTGRSIEAEYLEIEGATENEQITQEVNSNVG